jgi:uncharacterized membrane protein YedE/YeeE
MTFDLTSSLEALVGGVLIGAGSLMAALASGKIPGVSGLCSKVLWPRAGDTAWRVAFLVGLIGGAGAVFGVRGAAATFSPVIGLTGTVLAGLLVGFGTRLGGGCTSGHGVCGIGLWSRSALVATVVFMAAGMLVVFIVNQVAP